MIARSLGSRAVLALLGFLLLICIAGAADTSLIDDALARAQEFEAQERYTEAIRILGPVAASGDARVEYHLAFAHMSAAIAGVREENVGRIDIAPALKWAEQSAKQGNGAALNLLSIIYSNGFGVPRDDEKAMRYLRQAVDAGDEGARLNLAVRLYTGAGIPRDVAQACKYFVPLADREPPVVVAYYVGLITYRGECGIAADRKAGVSMIRIAAESGMPEAERDMGRIYRQGLTVDADMKRALEWYERAASHGDAESHWHLGMAHVTGNGRKRDSRMAVAQFQAAADSGFVDGIVSLAVMYATGDGVAQDFAKSRELYERAADLGSAAAHKNLAVMYARGEGMPPDMLRALVLVEQALALGSEDAGELRRQLRALASNEQRDAADREVAVWQESRSAR